MDGFREILMIVGSYFCIKLLLNLWCYDNNILLFTSNKNNKK